MSKFKFGNLKKSLLGATLLKSAPVLMGKEGGKDQLGVNYLVLEETPGRNTTICMPKETENVSTSELVSQWIPSDLMVVVNPFERAYTEIVFSVRDMVADDEDHILLLAYSQKLTPSPDIATPRSKNKFQLDINTLEVLGMYDIPAQSLFPQPSTRIGSANVLPRSIVSFSVNLDTLALSIMMEKRESIYLQAALLLRSEFDAERFENMILSEVDTISFVRECPEDRQEFVESDVVADTKTTRRRY